MTTRNDCYESSLRLVIWTVSWGMHTDLTTSYTLQLVLRPYDLHGLGQGRNIWASLLVRLREPLYDSLGANRGQCRDLAKHTSQTTIRVLRLVVTPYDSTEAATSNPKASSPQVKMRALLGKLAKAAPVAFSGASKSNFADPRFPFGAIAAVAGCVSYYYCYSSPNLARAVKMRMLRGICGHFRRDKIRNEDIRDKVGVTFTGDKMSEARLIWFGHVKRRCSNSQ
ncbi:hypothetical protein FXO37_05076 [Capsicum annuum]|nr:hypothetical protein FXO37_05076 [Capsicum annuum]